MQTGRFEMTGRDGEFWNIREFIVKQSRICIHTQLTSG